MASYRVTGPYITVRTATANGIMNVGLYAGTPVPDDVPEEQIRHHLETGQIEAVPEPAPLPAPAPAPRAEQAKAEEPRRPAQSGAARK